MDSNLPPISAPTSAHSARVVNPQRHRRPAMVAALALALAVSVGGAAHAGGLRTASLLDFSSASLLTTNRATVASSVDGAVVDIVSTLGYQNAKAAGTGMILTSTGEILTNNHVINGATSLQVTVVATGRTYTATVVGTDPTADVAVIQLTGASGLKTIPIGDSTAVKVGQSVVASGNAGGVGGAPSVVKGKVVALNQAITAGDEGSSDTERLTGLIESDAPIAAGDSGGPLALAGTVIGMNTAASSTTAAAVNGESAGAAEAYAIPIRTALTIAQQIETGQASSTVHLGVHGFLGVQLAGQNTGSDGYYPGGGFAGGYAGGDPGAYYGGGTDSSSTVSGAVISGVVDSGAAQAAGLSAGDVITSVDGKTVADADALNTVLAATRSGQQVSLGWTDVNGQSHTGTVTLGAAAAD